MGVVNPQSKYYWKKVRVKKRQFNSKDNQSIKGERRLKATTEVTIVRQTFRLGRLTAEINARQRLRRMDLD